MTQTSFEQLLESDKPNKPDTEHKRDKFLSRLFGIFSEEVVRIWCRDFRSPYKDLGRPTLKLLGEKRGLTLDFTFEHELNSCKYVVELKCELEFENYRYLKLTSPSQLKHHTSSAFVSFCEIAKHPSKYTITVDGEIIAVNGSILIWGSITPEGRDSVIKGYGFKDVLSLEQIIDDLLKWDNQDYSDLITERETWCQYLFERLAGKS